MALTDWGVCPDCDSTAVNVTIYADATVDLKCESCGYGEECDATGLVKIR